MDSADRLTRGVSDGLEGLGGDIGSGWEGVGSWIALVVSTRRQREQCSRRRCIDVVVPMMVRDCRRIWSVILVMSDRQSS